MPAGSCDRHPYAVDAASGKLAWSLRTPGAVASPTVAEDLVAFGTADGPMLLVDLASSGAGSP